MSAHLRLRPPKHVVTRSASPHDSRKVSCLGARGRVRVGVRVGVRVKVRVGGRGRGSVRVRLEEGVLLDLAVAVEDLAELLHLLEAWRGVG